MQNATYLFELPSRQMKSSESRWTAVAQMSLTYLSTLTHTVELPVYGTDNEGWLTAVAKFPARGFRFDNMVCEQGLSAKLFAIDGFDVNFDRLVPDILHFDRKNGGKSVIIIEVKTLSESVGRNIKLYADCVKYLEDRGFECSLFYLLSHGHEIQRDWSLLCNAHSQIILWEDLFREIASSPMAEAIAPNLSSYCELPAVRPD